MIRAFSLALLFLTRFPVPLWFKPLPRDWGRSVFFFPVVGFLIGTLLVGLYSLFPYVDPGVLAVVLLALWTLISGGLHLDGLADTVDAWAGSHNDPEKALAVMKDARSGPHAVAAVVLVLLAKFSALRVVLEHEAWEVLLGAPILGHTAIVLMLLTTPAARAQRGAGGAHAEHLPRAACLILAIAVAMLIVWQLGWEGVALLALLAMGFIYLRQGLMERIGGTTGEVLGAACELTEAGALVILVLLAG